MDFDEFQAQCKRTRVFRIQSEGEGPIEALLTRHYLVAGAISHVGEIASRLKKRLRDGEDYILLKDEIKEQIGHTLWYLATLADELGFSLNEIVQENTGFNERRWHQVTAPESASPLTFDAEFPESEQLPNNVVAQFESEIVEGIPKTTVWIYPKWPDREGRVRFGEPIDDNSTIDDHYRYHDVYHFACVTFLAWSPVVRALLKCKRKSNEDVDRIQDGARARDTEEASTAFIYSYVSQQSYLETSDNIDTSVLTAVRTLLRAYEVKACAEKDWERAILEATRVLRELVKNRGGWVEANRDRQSLTYFDPSGGDSK